MPPVPAKELSGDLVGREPTRVRRNEPSTRFNAAGGDIRLTLRIITGILVLAFLVVNNEPITALANDDPNCIATGQYNGNWYANFQNIGFADSTVAGCRRRLNTAPLLAVEI